MSNDPTKRPPQVTHTLVVPVTFEGQERTEITFRRVKGKDIRAIGDIESEVDQTFMLMQRLSGWPPEGLDELDGEDFDAAGRIVEGFMGRRRRPSQTKRSAS